MLYSHVLFFLLIFFFFKQKTAYEMRISDWSSDVCSSDLPLPADFRETHRERARARFMEGFDAVPGAAAFLDELDAMPRAIASSSRAEYIGWALGRSEERRVGKECVSTCRSRW